MENSRRKSCTTLIGQATIPARGSTRNFKQDVSKSYPGLGRCTNLTVVVVVKVQLTVILGVLSGFFDNFEAFYFLGLERLSRGKKILINSPQIILQSENSID